MRILFKMTFLLLYTFSCHADEPFSFLNTTHNWAKTLQEYPDKDRGDWLNPVFDSVIEKQMPSGWSRMLQFFGLRKRVGWTPEIFKTLLEKLTKYREELGMHGRFVMKMRPKPGTRFIIWGDLQGAFHSLMRDLQELKHQEIINDRFEIIHKDVYFIFNGDLIDRSPYSVETLTVVLRLMERNPDRVIYMRGTHEDKGHWKDYGLKRELVIKASSISSEEIPLEDEVDKFFNTLPLALFLIGDETDEKISLVKISHFAMDGDDITHDLPEIAVKKLSGFFHKPDSQRVHVLGLPEPRGPKEIELKAVFKGESRTRRFAINQGLRFIGKTNGSVAWNILSAPTGTYRRLYQFFFDAFTVLTIFKKLDDWTITLFHQDVRSLTGFKKAITYNLVTGLPVGSKEEIEQLESRLKKIDDEIQELRKNCELSAKKIKKKEIEPKKDVVETPKTEQLPVKAQKKEAPEKQMLSIHDGEITIGSLMDLSKGLQENSMVIREAISRQFDKINSSGGIDGRLVRLIFLDDEYTPSISIVQSEELLKKYQTNVILCPVGTPTLKAYLDRVENQELLVLFPWTGAAIFRKPTLKNIINYRASYAQELQALADYFVNERRKRKIAIFYQNDSYGIGGFESFKAIAKELGVENLIEIPHERNDVNFQAESDKIKHEDPEVIGCISTPSAIRGLIRQLGVDFSSTKEWFAISFSGGPVLQKFTKEKGIPMVYSNVVPDPTKSNLKLVEEFRKLMLLDKTYLNAAALEGYIAARLFTELLSKVKGAITQDKIIDVAEHWKDFDLDGLKLSWDPQRRQLSNKVWLDLGAQGWIEKTITKVAGQQPSALPQQEEPEQKKPEQEKEVQAPQEESQEIAVRDNEIVFGSLQDFSRSLKTYSEMLTAGLKAALSVINDNGGIHGKSLRLIALDDEYTPSITRERIEDLIHKHKTDILLSPMGTPTMAAYLEKLKNGELLSIFPDSGSYRLPGVSHVLHLRASFADEAFAATNYVLEKGAKKFAFFYQDDGFGKDLLAGALSVLKKHDIADSLQVSYERHTTSFAHQAQEIVTYNPDAIGFFGTPVAVQELVRNIAAIQGDFLSEKILFGNAALGQDSFKKFMKERSIHMIIPQVLPNPHLSNLKIAKEFRRIAELKGIPVDAISFEGFVNGLVLGEILKKIDGPFTKEKFINAAQATKDLDFKDLQLSFVPEHRELLNSIWLDTGDDKDWIEVRFAHGSHAH